MSTNELQQHFESEEMTTRERASYLEAYGIMPSLPPIEDVRGKLPVHPVEQYDWRDVSVIEQVVIHHSANNGDIPPENVANYHVNSLGWPGIGYHVYITDDGICWICNDLTTISWHASGSNTVSVGVCLAGSFMGAVVPTSAQLTSCRMLLDWLAAYLGIERSEYYGHYDVGSTACPGSTFEEWREKLS